MPPRVARGPQVEPARPDDSVARWSLTATATRSADFWAMRAQQNKAAYAQVHGMGIAWSSVPARRKVGVLATGELALWLESPSRLRPAALWAPGQSYGRLGPAVQP